MTTALRSQFLGLESRLHGWLRARAHRRSPLPPHLLLGERGEDAAFFHLRSLGHTIVARRWRSPRLPGDLDLVAWEGDVLAIVEVKTRSERDLFPARAQVGEAKQQMLRRMARAYIAQLPREFRRRVRLRFDVLEVYLLDARPGRTVARTDFDLHRAAFPVEPEQPTRRPF